jgi:hypothetical protein
MAREDMTRSKSLVYIGPADLHQPLGWHHQDTERELEEEV